MISDIQLSQNNLDFSDPILLYDKNSHKIYWLGMAVADAFRTNIYLIVDGDEALIIDSGNKSFFSELYQRINKLGHIDKIKGAVYSHQDPDVAGSIADWIDKIDDIQIITSQRTNILLPHYGLKNYNFFDAGESNQHQYKFSSGNIIQFIDAHFLHFPGAIATHDPISGYLFSGDIWASIDMDFNFIVNDFEDHILKLNLFHLDYMSSSVATRGFAQSLDDYSISAILPQHGAIIGKENIQKAINYLKELRCGLDLIYPEL